MRITIDTIDKVYKAQKASVETMELKGYELIKEFFVDSSGFGLDNEPALTKNQFELELYKAIRDNDENGTKKLTAKITGVGQFQVYVGLFKKVAKSQVKVVSKNVLTRNEGQNFIVRLYETDILKINTQNSEVELYSGGYHTVTTKKWLNKYLPNGVYVYQKNWDWFVSQDGQNIPFTEGIKLSL